MLKVMGVILVTPRDWILDIWCPTAASVLLEEVIWLFSDGCNPQMRPERRLR